MSGTTSKNKGKRWENEVAKFLTSLYNQSFIRTPSSGAYIGGKNVVRKEFLHEGQIRNMKGDIIPPHEWKYFNCEAKNYGEFPFHQLPKGNVKLLEDWIDQCCQTSDLLDIDILIIKVTRLGTYVAIPNLSEINPGINYITYSSKNHGIWYIVDFENFWKLNKQAILDLSTQGLNIN
jgi:hypothetical protein